MSRPRVCLDAQLLTDFRDFSRFGGSQWEAIWGRLWSKMGLEKMLKKVCEKGHTSKKGLGLWDP